MTTNARKQAYLLLILLVLVLLACSAGAQTTPVPAGGDALLAEGQAYVASLKLDQQLDSKLFVETGLDKSRDLLMAVMGHGQAPTASSEDWRNLHRATAGLIELSVFKGELLRASVFATFQNSFYRNFEQDYGEGLKASLLALDLKRRSGLMGNIDLDLASVGRDYMSLGQADKALSYFREAQAASSDKTSPRTAQNWRSLIQAELALKRHDQARQDLNAFLNLASTGPAGFQVEAFLSESDVLMDEEHFDESLTSVKAAAEASKRDPNIGLTFVYEEVNQLMAAVLACMQTLPYTEAIALAERIDREFPGLPIPVGAFARGAITVRRRLAGDIDGILREQSAALEAAKEKGNVREQISLLRMIAANYQGSNSTRNQINALERAVELESTLLTPEGRPVDADVESEYFGTLNTLGEAYVRSRQAQQAREAFDRVLKTIQGMNDARSKQRVAKAYGRATLGEAAVAELTYAPQRARDILTKALQGESDPRGAFAREDVLLQAARLERNRGERPKQAMEYYAAAIEVLRSTKQQSQLLATTLEYIHFLSTSASGIPNALQKAGEQLGELTRLAETIKFADAQWRLNYEAGILAELHGETVKAIDLYKTGVSGLETLRAGLSQQGEREALIDSDLVQDLYRRLVTLLLERHADGEAFRYLEQSKARSFLDALQGRRFRQGENPASRELEGLEKEIVNLRLQLTSGNESILRGSGKEPALLAAELAKVEAKFAFVREQGGLRERRATQPLSLQPVTVQAVQKQLPKRTALVEYAVLNGRLAAFVIERTSCEVISWTVDTKRLPGLVQGARSLLSRESSQEELSQKLEALSVALLKPVLPKLSSRVERIIFVPTAELNYLPFQALPGRPGLSLIDSYAISYVPSASTLDFLQDQEPFSEDLFLGALGNLSVEGMTRLPGTLQEAHAIAKSFPHATLASEGSFTHAAAKDALLQHSAVHFATHGIVDPEAPLLSSVLTGPAPGQSSHLFLYELTQMQLRAKLVVLSACDTNVGRLSKGDEVASLTRTFLLAGAETVVSSLWQVNDRSTALLMEGFYGGLRKGKGPAEALRDAALEVRKEYPHPFFWAPFVVTGIH